MLKICRTFFESLNSRKIRYCHWKSNSHLDLALAGKTDLDILIFIDDSEEFKSALNVFSFKKIISPPEKQFPGLEDYIGFDNDTGEFIHLHVHYRLVLGQRFIKNHHLPLEALFFDNLTLKNGVYIPCPELELLVLIIRAHMKVEYTSLLKHAIRDITAPGYTAFPSAIENELAELVANSDIEKMEELLKESKLPLRKELFSVFLDRFATKKLKFFHILSTQKEVLTSLKEFRRDKSLLVSFRYLYLLIKSLPIVNKLESSKGKTLECEGRVIALVGADGAGKSTLIADLEKWLSWKLSVSRYYYGIPKNAVSKIVDITIRVLNKFRLNTVSSAVSLCFWLYVAKGRAAIYKQSNKDKAEGKMVIADRFPLRDFHSMPEPMDGPRIANTVKTHGYFASKEQEYYASIGYPDRVYVLQVDIEELRRRKTDLSVETHMIKAKAVNKIEGGGPIVLIDANKPYLDVLLEIKREIWGLIVFQKN